jgi:hypothetical protein
MRNLDWRKMLIIRIWMLNYKRKSLRSAIAGGNFFAGKPDVALVDCFGFATCQRQCVAIAPRNDEGKKGNDEGFSDRWLWFYR